VPIDLSELSTGDQKPSGLTLLPDANGYGPGISDAVGWFLHWLVLVSLHDRRLTPWTTDLPPLRGCCLLSPVFSLLFLRAAISPFRTLQNHIVCRQSAAASCVSVSSPNKSGTAVPNLLSARQKFNVSKPFPRLGHLAYKVNSPVSVLTSEYRRRHVERHGRCHLKKRIE
jgi:hypothetical protein